MGFVFVYISQSKLSPRKKNVGTKFNLFSLYPPTHAGKGGANHFSLLVIHYI